MWKNISIKWKILLGFLFVVILAVAVQSIAYVQLLRIQKELTIAESLSLDTNKLLTIEAAHLAWANDVTKILFNRDGKAPTVVVDGHLCAFGKWLYGDGRQTLESRLPESNAILTAIEPLHLRLHETAKFITDHMEQGDHEAALDIYYKETSVLLPQIREKLHSLIGMTQNAMEAENDRVDEVVQQIQMQSMVFMGILFALSVLIAIATSASITKPLTALVAFSRKVAGGDLEATTSLLQQDEIGTLADSLRLMVNNLKKTVGLANEQAEEANKQSEQAKRATEEANNAKIAAERAKKDGMLAAAEHIEEVVSVISSVTEALSKHVTDSERGADQQAARMIETATAMEEMNSTVSEISRNASTAAQLSKDASENAMEGAKFASNVATSIRDVQHHSANLKDGMLVLTEHAKAINQIMSVISDIADQTNLLALNAAIEAARAGEAGRGFAVVADEVRKLAEKTMTSTADVGRVIGDIQTATAKSSAQVDMTVDTVNSVVVLAEKSGSTLHHILEMAERTADQVRSIAAASEEQSASSDEINRSVQDVNHIANNTAGVMQKAASSVSELSKQASALAKLVQHLKTA